jgi:uncharacterized protein (TIGR03083 family)
VAHVLSFEDLSRFAAVRLIIRGRIGRTPGNELAMAPYRQWSAARLTDRMSSHLTPTGLTSGFNGGIALADGMIHQQDIRRPLAIRRTIPPDRVVAALQIAVGAPTLPSRRRIKGVQLVATDINWSHGRGPALRGTAEALLMLTAGREEAAAECAGPGLDRWRQR